MSDPTPAGAAPRAEARGHTLHEIVAHFCSHCGNPFAEGQTITPEYQFVGGGWNPVGIYHHDCLVMRSRGLLTTAPRADADEAPADFRVQMFAEGGVSRVVVTGSRTGIQGEGTGGNWLFAFARAVIAGEKALADAEEQNRPVTEAERNLAKADPWGIVRGALASEERAFLGLTTAEQNRLDYLNDLYSEGGITPTHHAEREALVAKKYTEPIHG